MWDTLADIAMQSVASTFAHSEPALVENGAESASVPCIYDPDNQEEQLGENGSIYISAPFVEIDTRACGFTIDDTCTVTLGAVVYHIRLIEPLANFRAKLYLGQVE